MTAVYNLVSLGAAPVTLAELKTYLKLPSSFSTDDTILNDLIEACTQKAECMSGRSFRTQTWELLIDEFPSDDRITINRSPVATITSIEHLVSDVFTLFAASNYYLKQLNSCSEIVLKVGLDWPTNTDDIEQAVKITFDTGAYSRFQELTKMAIMRLIAYMYYNRGDCGLEEACNKCGTANELSCVTIPKI